MNIIIDATGDIGEVCLPVRFHLLNDIVFMHDKQYFAMLATLIVSWI